jgi:hypothetical protein
MRRGVLFLLFLLSCFYVKAQQDSLKLDSLVQDSITIDSTHSSVARSDSAALGDTIVAHPGTNLAIPRKALYRSLMIPGWGQIYNKRAWKVPIVYAALGGMTAVALWNRSKYREFADYYRKSVDKQPHPYDFLSAASLHSIRDSYRQNMELSWIGVAAIYGLQAMEAYINAHLKTFDITDDIGMKIHPSMVNPSSPGIGMTISF